MDTYMSWPRITSALAAVALLAGPGAGEAQVAPSGEVRPVTLEEAVAEAMRASPDVEAARARARAAEQGGRAARSFQWPTVALEAGAIRTTDPVGAFGGRLRQARFTEADFDPARLNRPDALTDWSGAVGASWTPLDFSSLAAASAAAREADAAGLGAEWATRAAGFRAEARYVEALAAERRLDAARAAEAAAAANLGVVERRAEEGALTDADVLQARAAVSGAEARRIDAERGVADARDRLAVAMGWPVGMEPLPVDSSFQAPEAGDPAGLERRADLRASAAQVEAEAARVRQARRARIPSVQGFARIETHSDQVVEDIQDNWTVGFQLQVPLFTGFEIDARTEAAAAMREAAAREHEQRLREARAEVAEARRAVEAATRGAVAARAAADAAEEAARLMRRRFEEGMTTTADLLDAEARAAQLRTGAVNAELMRHLAAARLAFLTDTDTEHLRGGMDR
jgi:outer membrane protein TolC